MKDLLPGAENFNREKLSEGADELLVENLFRKYYAPLCKTINRLTNDQEAAKDIVQDVFLKLWKGRVGLDPSLSAKSYLYRSAINTAYNYLERNKRSQPLQEEDTMASHISVNHTEEQYAALELSENISKALDLLPPRCKAVFLLSRYEDMSYKEIAEALDLSVKTVENQVGKALALLRKYLKVYLSCLGALFINFINFFFNA